MSVPPYRREALDRLRATVEMVGASGETRLPGERLLARALGISRGTVRSLLAELELEGQVQARARSGWHVHTSAISEPRHSLVGFSEMSRLGGREPSSRVLSAVVRPGSEVERSQLRLEGSGQVWALCRLRCAGGQPTSVEEVVLPWELSRDLVGRDFSTESLFTALSEIGVDVTRTDVVVSAGAAEGDVADLLEVPPGTPLLLQDETGFNQYGREVFVCSASYRADRYRFRSSLSRRVRK